uniref:Tail tape measure n=1 Tax=Salmonella phage vB_SE130_2P TaxID=3236707 RepID=A0AB39C4U5_9VIRU
MREQNDAIVKNQQIAILRATGSALRRKPRPLTRKHLQNVKGSQRNK